MIIEITINGKYEKMLSISQCNRVRGTAQQQVLTNGSQNTSGLTENYNSGILFVSKLNSNFWAMCDTFLGDKLKFLGDNMGDSRDMFE